MRDLDDEKDARKADKDGNPTLSKDSGDVSHFNLLVKKTGPMHPWKGLATVTAPSVDGQNGTDSSKLARVALAQRKDVVRAACDRLYPKLRDQPKQFALQPFEDAYADDVDLDCVGEETETVPLNMQFLEKGRNVVGFR